MKNRTVAASSRAVFLPESRCFLTLSRVLIADDHRIVAEGVRSILERHYEIVGMVNDGQELISEASRLKPDVIVLDIGMPLLNGFEAGRRLKECVPGSRLVFLTMKDDVNLAAATLDLHPVGYVLKNAGAAELLKAIDEVLHGRSYVTERLRPENWAEQAARARQYSKNLTQRQLEVVQLLAEGRPMKEVGDILQISEKTVMFHKYQVMKAFNLKTNADLVLFAHSQHLVS
jgi:DNA-binding NarL/FixJ family response regulator